MAALEKLAIRGIRSFDDKRVEVVQFFTPVTVIVGQNGSGKTTIIECLKYATTGDQPPNTRGGAFVHDPKMAAEKEVKAQVKLRFKAANGHPMLVTRNLSVTQKKTAGMTMKTLEAILAALPREGGDGKRATISTKCAEMDAEIPHLLGVSKAVLENVIFCHQEDSYWPLAEASVLKKKFDDIFEASKYTKALDAIKSLRKERVADLKLDKERLDMSLREKNHADKLKKRISDLNATIAAKDMEYHELKEKAEALAIQNKEFYERATKFRDIYRQYEAAQARKQQLESDRRDISDSLDIIEGADHELEERRRNFEQHIVMQRSKRDRKARDLKDEEERLVDIRHQLGEEQKREGQLVGEEQAYHRNIARRDALVREISKKNGIKGFDHDTLDRNQWSDFRLRMNDLQRRHGSTVEGIQTEGQEKNQEFTVQLQTLHANIATLKAERESLQKQIADRQRVITSAESRLDVIQTKSSELKIVLSDVKQKKARIDALNQESHAHEFDKKLEEKASAMRELESQRERLNNELASSTQQMESRTNLSLRKEEAQKLDLEIQNTLNTMSLRYQQLLGHKPVVESVERELDRGIMEKEREIHDMEAESSSANRRLTQVESTISNLKNQQKVMSEEMKSLERKIAPIRGDHPSLKHALADTNEQMNLCQREIAKHSGSSAFYQSILATGRKDHVCSSCNRHLKTNEMAAFEKHVNGMLDRTAAPDIKALEDELVVWEADLAKIQQALPMEATYSKLQDVDLPRINQELEKLDSPLKDATAEAETLSGKIESLKSSLKSLQSLKQQASSMTAAIQRKDAALQYVKNLEGILHQGSPIKSLDDIQTQLSNLQSQQYTIDREKQKISTDRENLNRVIRAAESELHQLALQQNQLENEVKESERLERQMAEDHEAIAAARSRIKDVEQRLSQASEPVEAVKSEQAAFTIKHNSRVADANQQLQAVNLSIDKLDSASQSVEEYIKDQGPRKLKDCREKVIDHQEAIQQSLADIEKMRVEVETLGTEVSSASTTLSNLKDNIRLRKISHDIAAVDTELGGLDLEEASRARQQFDEKYPRAKASEEEATRQSQHLQGEISSLRTQLKGLEMDGREYKDATKKYTEQLVKTKMADMVNNDLEKYAKALDSAIMKYHSIKMAEVNDTMRHLWNRTYQGTDIDGIKIISEGEGATGRRTYNYRVVMVKDQVEMDMRGRCSAGQKMLASIIIRLALSDSFGANCGILALDEPTNALDVENIEALAQSLVDIIRERRKQANFQLIIITHDEGFLRKLGEASVIDYYWRVSRDGRLKSTVEKQAINL